MFSGLALRYDRFNRWSSLGLVDVWRRRLADEILPRSRVLDVGAGTGGLTRLAARRAGSQGFCAGVDISPAMLVQAAAGPQDEGGAGLAWAQSSAAALPFAEGTFDAVVSAFVLRNLRQAGVMEPSLREARRVLRPGGRLLFLDLTRPESLPLRWGHALYARTAVSWIGRGVFGSAWPGPYLRRTIEDLPPAQDMRKRIEACGFAGVSVRPLHGGLVSLFSGIK